jgi:hypothetical protein
MLGHVVARGHDIQAINRPLLKEQQVGTGADDQGFEHEAGLA